jgi:OmcA/MtrC family decaheme c-type cytochrome
LFSAFSSLNPFRGTIASEYIGHSGVIRIGSNGTSTSGWSGFGAKPLASRIHGVHRGHYLEHPEDVKPLYRLVNGVPVYQPDYDFSEVIFPQDIRNCTKCHADNPMWAQEPSRLACLACHDSDEAIFHGALMTFDLTPEDPYGGDEIETCIICHGEHSAFSPDQVHNISNPYKPPYPREPAGE